MKSVYKLSVKTCILVKFEGYSSSTKDHVARSSKQPEAKEFNMKENTSLK